jgi:hypothetical protein
MSKAEEALQKLVALAKELYRCEIEARISYFPVSGNAYIEITAISGSDLFMCLFCAQFPDEIDGFPVYLSEAFKNKLFDLPPIDRTTN